MVDLTLASSYIPAFTCLAKSICLASGAYLLLPDTHNDSVKYHCFEFDFSSEFI
jgi:hypothetical protein